MNARIGHHGSHATLLDLEPPAGEPSTVDAIIVPSVRPPAYLREALILARDLACPLFVLCSQWATAAAASRAAREVGARVIAVDVHGDARLPAFETSRLMAAAPFKWRADSGLKRNVSLAVARMAGWNRVLFLDDDMFGLSASDVGAAAGLLGAYRVVGLRNVGFPDNSVVCHAYRAVGNPQDSFVGGGAMAVAVGGDGSFFPNVYNEDWFFLLDDAGIGRVAVTGRVAQKPFDPYRTTERALREEFGDCLAEGLFALLDAGGKLTDADVSFWRGFLAQRERMVAGIMAKVPHLAKLTSGERGRMIDALKAAQGRRRHVRPQLCVDFINAWRADRKAWHDFLVGLPVGLTPSKALYDLGLAGQTEAQQRGGAAAHRPLARR